MSLTEIIAITLIFNIFCGIFRVRQDKLKWKLFYIHIPIPLIAYLRISSGISYKFIPVLVIVAFFGQYLGGKINKAIFPHTMAIKKQILEDEE